MKEKNPSLNSNIISIQGLSKSYHNGLKALGEIDLDIREGEILALLGPNGAGKTTLISIICGLVNPTAGRVTVGGYDIISDFLLTRKQIGLVPQELSVHAFETVLDTVNFTRGLFGKAPNPDYIEKLLKSLTLWDKKDSMIMTLSGGMKRRVLIAKALAHEPRILFLDEPTAGVDVELRKDMWNIVNELSKSGVTIILTTHYIEEAEEIADRIGIMSKGNIILVEDKNTLMKKLGKKQLTLSLVKEISKIPAALKKYKLEISTSGKELIFTYDTKSKENGITQMLDDLKKAKISFMDLDTTQSSLEEIFVQLVND